MTMITSDNRNMSDRKIKDSLKKNNKYIYIYIQVQNDRQTDRQTQSAFKI